MRNKALENIKIKKLDDLFGIDNGEIQDIPVEELAEFKGHPFNVIHDEDMDSLIESIKENGVLTPGICRKIKNGYEIISGHRRKYACSILKIKTMPMIVKDLDDDEAVIYMVDSNLQRENILISEKARAYGMKYQSIKNKGGNSLDELSEESGESQKTIQRLIYISRLIPELLVLVDDKVLGKSQALDLSFLKNEEQKELFENFFKSEPHSITVAQSSDLKKCSQSGKLNLDLMHTILDPPVKHRSSRKINIPDKKLSDYFDDSYTQEAIESLIYELLKEWKDGRIII